MESERERSPAYFGSVGTFLMDTEPNAVSANTGHKGTSGSNMDSIPNQMVAQAKSSVRLAFGLDSLASCTCTLMVKHACTQSWVEL